MVAISFSDTSFIRDIIAGTKKQTVRRFSPPWIETLKRNPKLQLYYKQRSRNGFKFADAVLEEVFPIALLPDAILRQDGQDLDSDAFAKADGFKNYSGMLAWFAGNYSSQAIEETWMVIRFREVAPRICAIGPLSGPSQTELNDFGNINQTPSTLTILDSRVINPRCNNSLRSNGKDVTNCYTLERAAP